MTESIDLFEAIDSQRAIRRFKPDPVPDELITRLLRAAIKAPSGGIQQGWSFIVIRGQETKNKIGELYRTGDRFSITPELTGQVQRVYGAAQYLEDFTNNIEAILGKPGPVFVALKVVPEVENVPIGQRIRWNPRTRDKVVSDLKEALGPR